MREDQFTDSLSHRMISKNVISQNNYSDYSGSACGNPDISDRGSGSVIELKINQQEC